MRRSWLAVVMVTAVLGGTVFAATLDDFKNAVDKKGCDSIPYSDLRGTCSTKSTQVDDWCKNSSKPISCDGLDPSGLLAQIENVKKKIEELKRERDELASKISAATDDAERRSLEDKKKEVENKIYELEQKVAEWERKLSDEKTAINDRIYNGEYCVGYRKEVQRAFADARSNAERESDPEIKPYAEKLIEKWKAGEPTHAEEIANYEKAVAKCKGMR